MCESTASRMHAPRSNFSFVRWCKVPPIVRQGPVHVEDRSGGTRRGHSSHDVGAPRQIGKNCPLVGSRPLDQPRDRVRGALAAQG